MKQKYFTHIIAATFAIICFFSVLPYSTASAQALTADKKYQAGDIIEFGYYGFGPYDSTNLHPSGQSVPSDAIPSKPIEWIILEVKGNQLLLLSKNILNYSSFHFSQLGEPLREGWSDSSLREWLGWTYGQYIFTNIDGEHIVYSTITTKEGSRKDKTSDDLFLLSSSEYEKYRKIINKYDCGETYYASLHSPGLIYDSIFWWLRDSDDSPDRRNAVFMTSGDPTTQLYPAVGGIRPAVWVELK